MTRTEPAPDVPTRVIDGAECTTRAGIARLAGWKAGRSVTVRAGTDPDFPRPIRGALIGRDYWYPLAGDHGVHAYLAVLARRAHDKKPPAVVPGDPNELLRPADAATAMHIDAATFRSYVRHSIPYWIGAKTGRPLVPHPDDVQGGAVDAPHVRRRWRRGTLAAHQANRPGPGAGAGRPTGPAQPSA